MADDFFDEDLVDATSVGEETGIPAPAGAPPAATRSGAGQMRMHRQKEELTTQVADAVKEIESLRMRQELLEKERNDLQDLARRQDDYEAAKGEIMEHLSRSILHLERDEQQANRYAQLMAVMRERFKDTLEELRGINEAGWSKEGFQTELNKAVVLVEDARSVYRRGLAKIDAENWHQVQEGAQQPSVLTRSEPLSGLPRRFGFWFRAGLAFSIPMIVIALLVFGTAVALRFKGWY